MLCISTVTAIANHPPATSSNPDIRAIRLTPDFRRRRPLLRQRSSSLHHLRYLGRAIYDGNHFALGTNGLLGADVLRNLFEVALPGIPITPDLNPKHLLPSRVAFSNISVPPRPEAFICSGTLDTLAKGALVCNKCDAYPKVYGMSGLPTQVPWRRFVCVLRKLGYTARTGKAGAARSFLNPSRNPNVVSLREPHPGDNLGQAMLRQYLRKLLLDPDDFMRLLEKC